MDTKVILVIASIIGVLRYISNDTEIKKKLKRERILKKYFGKPT